jgi:hypothetical protein
LTFLKSKVSQVFQSSSLPVFERGVLAHLVQDSRAQEQEVGLLRDAHFYSRVQIEMRFVSSVDEIAEITDVECDAALVLEDFEVLVLEFSSHVRAFGEDGIHCLDLIWQGKEEEHDETVDGPVFWEFRLWVEGDAAEGEDVPEDGEDEGPCEVAGFPG